RRKRKKMDNEHGSRHEQIVSHFLLKTLHIVLNSRLPSLPLSLSLPLPLGKKTDKWFNLALGPPTDFTRNLNLMDPIIIDIILVQHNQSAAGYGSLLETVIERWAVQYEQHQQHHSISDYKKTYKKSIILLRSLYSIMRLLPAYRAYRTKAKAKSACHFDITYNLSSFTVPFTTSEEHLMKLYTFLPVEAQHGRLSVSVRYRETLSDFNLETSASFPTEIITDYVGSPATDPFRAFPPPQRPHSWTSGGLFTQNQSSPVAVHHSSSGRYDLSSYHSSSYDVNAQRTRLPTHHSFDDSPPFSPSPPTDAAFDSQSGVGGKQGKKSQDAAVGALVRMLRTAPPLRQDSSCCSDHVEARSNASELFMSRKTSDALEELKAYTGIKHLILSKSKDTL
ncbi:hypothetical protein M8C21_012290, partial [Ambrosia artemisiifolia]